MKKISSNKFTIYTDRYDTKNKDGKALIDLTFDKWIRNFSGSTAPDGFLENSSGEGDYNTYNIKIGNGVYDLGVLPYRKDRSRMDYTGED